MVLLAALRVDPGESDDHVLGEKGAELMDHEPIHTWFELTYSQYLTIPRSVLQSMPTEWQARFVACLEELDEAIEWRPAEGRYWVRLKDGRGRFVHDQLMDYQRGRRRLTTTNAGGKR